MSDPGSDDFQAAMDSATELYQRYHAENEPERLDEAIGRAEEALALAAAGHQRMQALSIKATCLQDRYWRTMSLADLDESVRLFQESAKIAPKDKSHLQTVYGLGLSLLARFREISGTEDPAAARRDLELAMDRLEFAVRLVEFNRLDRMKLAVTLDDLGTAYLEKYKLDGKRRDGRRAAQCQDRSLKLLPPLRTLTFASIPGLERTTALCARHRGETYLEHFRRTGNASLLSSALEAFRFSLGLVSDPLTLEISADAWVERFRLSHDPRDRSAATQCLRDAVARGLEVAPLVALRAARRWLASLLDGIPYDEQDAGVLDEALEAAESGWQALQLIVQAQVNRTFEADARRHIVGFGAEAAFVLSRRGLVQQALRVAEATAASIAGEAQRSLSQELDQLSRQGQGELARSYLRLAGALRATGRAGEGRGDLGPGPGPGAEIAAIGDVIARIRALPGHERFGYLSDPLELHENLGKNDDWLHILASPWGTVGLVIRGDGGQDCAVLPGLTRDRVYELRESLSRLDAPHISPRSRDSRATAAMDCLADELWDRLETGLSLRSGTLVVFPGGTLATLPVGPARILDRSRRPRIDQSVMLFPSATLLARSLPGRSVEFSTALIVVNPELPEAQQDLAIVQKAFGAQNVASYVAGTAGRRDLLGEMERSSLIHFACHGEANLVDPEESSIKLGGGKFLAVGQLWDVDLGNSRLAVIGTCQSASAGGSLIDELMTFPTLFLRAGAGTVMATLWSVGDKAAASLLAMFYAQLTKGLDVAAALSQCQRSLMETPVAGLGPGDWAAFMCYG